MAADRCDVVVTDGFTGNVFLKTTEGASSWWPVLQEAVSNAARCPGPGAARSQRGAAPSRPETYGGAQLLGVKGVAVIGHGSSSRVAIANALSVAAEGAERISGSSQRVGMSLENRLGHVFADPDLLAPASPIAR